MIDGSLDLKPNIANGTQLPTHTSPIPNTQSIPITLVISAYPVCCTTFPSSACPDVGTPCCVRRGEVRHKFDGSNRRQPTALISG